MKNIVILGAGFGGLQAALRLGKSIKKLKLTEQYGITLVDKNSYHTFTPLLYKIAITSGNAAPRTLATFDLRQLLAGLPVTFVEGAVAAINIAERKVRLRNSEISFEYLVLALGAEVNYFGTAGAAEHAFPLKTFDDALKIRDALIAAVERANSNVVRVAVCGGGTIGMELAAEIAMQTLQSKAHPARNSPPQDPRDGATVNCSTISETSAGTNTTSHRVHVTIVEAGPFILAAMDPRVIRRAERRLKRLGVSILTRERIVEIFPSFALLASGEKVYFDICIWTGGVRPSSIAESLPFKKDSRGQIEVLQNLAASENVFVIGDIAHLTNPKTNEPVPGAACPAMMEGRTTAMNIVEEIKAKERFDPPPQPHHYVPRSYPYVVHVGGRYAIAKIGLFVIFGFPAWIFKGIVELNYFFSIMPAWMALRMWLRELFIFIKNDRLG